MQWVLHGRYLFLPLMRSVTRRLRPAESGMVSYIQGRLHKRELEKERIPSRFREFTQIQMMVVLAMSYNQGFWCLPCARTFHGVSILCD